MSWVRLDDSFFQNPKARAAGLAGRALYVAGLCYCGRLLTDGNVPKGEVRLLAAEADVSPRMAARLVESGLWIDEGDHYLIPDYLDYNPSKEYQEARKAERSAAGKKGAAARWGNSQRHDDSHSSSHGPRHGNPDGTYPIPPLVTTSHNKRWSRPGDEVEATQRAQSVTAELNAKRSAGLVCEKCQGAKHLDRDGAALPCPACNATGVAR